MDRSARYWFLQGPFGSGAALRTFPIGNHMDICWQLCAGKLAYFKWASFSYLCEGGDVADVHELRVLIDERIRARKLPEYGQHQLYAGKGDTQPCAACELVSARWEAQYDIEL